MASRSGKPTVRFVATLGGFASAWFFLGILLFILIAGDHERPEDAPAGWVEALQRMLAAAWLIAPVVAVAVFLAMRRRRRRRT